MYVCIKRKSDEDSHSNKTIEEGIQYKCNIVKHDNKIKEKENIKTRILEDKSWEDKKPKRRLKFNCMHIITFSKF